MKKKPLIFLAMIFLLSGIVEAQLTRMNPWTRAPDYISAPVEQSTIVAKGWGDHSTIQGAIDAITDASASNRYVIMVYPGTYTENVDFTDKPFIHLKAVGDPADTVITSTSGITLTLNNSDTRIENLKITSTGGQVLLLPADSATAHFRFFHCVLQATVVNDFTTMVEVKSGFVFFTEITFIYIQTGTGGGTHKIIDVTGAASVEISLCRTAMEIGSGAVADEAIGINEGNFVIRMDILASVFELARSGVVSGATTLYSADGTSGVKDLIGNHFHIENGGSGGTAAVYKTAGNGCWIHSTGNRILVEGFTLNCLANIAAGDSLSSHFDDVVAPDESIGGGTFYFVHSNADGNLDVSNDIHVERNALIDGTLELASGTTVNEISTVATYPASDDIILTEKAIEDHVHSELAEYVKEDGTVPFSGVVAGVTPTLSAHLATKGYTDGVAAGGGGNDLGPFVDKDLVTPPGGEILGDIYIIAGTGGDWAAYAINDVCTVSGVTPTTWSKETPVAGKHGWVTDEAVDYTFNGAAWVITGTLISHLSIQDIGTNAHSVVDTHIANVTTNPHVVTKTNVSLGNVTDDAQLKRASNDFNGFGAKVTPANNDRFLIEDSADSLSKKYVLASNMLDQRVKVSSNDTTQDYLMAKLVGSASTFTWTEVGDGGNETLQVGYGTELTTLTDGSNADALHDHNITNSQASATVITSTASTTYTAISGMTVTPAAGTYVVMFSSSGYGTVIAQEMMYAIHVDGTIVQHTEREKDFASGVQADDMRGVLHSQAVITVTGTEAIDVRFKTSSGTFYVLERSLILIKVS